MKQIIITLSILAFFYSCSEDKGNYEYEMLNTINKIENIKKEYNIYKGEDILKITPKFSFDIEENKDTYEYKWILNIPNKKTNKIDNRLISTSTEKPDLVFDTKVFDAKAVKDKKPIIPIKKLWLTFIAKNLTTGVSIFESFQVNFMNKYTNGIFILHENGENSELTLIKKNGTIAKNIYKKITGDDLKGKPIKILASTFKSSNERNDAEKYRSFILLTNGPDYGAVLKYSNLEYRYPISNCFRGKNPPKGLKFKISNPQSRVPYYFIINGKLYNTDINLQIRTNPYITLDYPEIENENELDYIYLPKGLIITSSNGKLYSKNKLLKIDLMPGKCFYIFEEFVKDPDFFATVKTYDYHILKKLDDNTVKDYLMHVINEVDYNTWETKITRKLTTHTFIAPNLITEKSFFVRSRQERYIYIAQGNKIYKYNYDAPNDRPELFKEFDAGLEITYFIKKEIYDDAWKLKTEEFIVCVYDPNKTEKDEAASLYHLDYSGNFIEKYKNICGKINSIVIKE
jgi:hypothetical protein